MFSNKLVFKPPVIAHRGLSRYAPENTLAAFRAAKAAGIAWVELDVMLTLDDEVVIIHDDLLDRTTNGKGPVGGCSYALLQTLDAGSWFKPQFAGEKIPTLRAALALFEELELSVNIEIKPQLGREERTVTEVLSLLQDVWEPAQFQVLISSFSLPALEYVRRYSTILPLGFLMHEWNNDWQKICAALNCISVNVNQEILTSDICKAIKASQRLLLAYTVNDSVRAEQLFAWGVDALFSDDPQALLKK